MDDRTTWQDWLYYRIYLTDLPAGDRVLERVVRPILANGRRESDPLRWFFIRFLDPTGLHLRLRLTAPPAQLERVERRCDAALAADPEVLRSVKSLYAPETRKFGGGAAMAFAEELFQRGSDVALECLGPRLGAMRAAYGATVATLLLTGLPAQQQLAFLHQYAWYWSGGRAGPGGRDTVARAERFQAQINEVLSDADVHRTLTDYRRDFWAALGSPRRRLVDRSDYFLLFHHLHLTNNRLGVYPAVEAGLARLLWAGNRTRIAAHRPH